ITCGVTRDSCSLTNEDHYYLTLAISLNISDDFRNFPVYSSTTNPLFNFKKADYVSLYNNDIYNIEWSILEQYCDVDTMGLRLR
ncbi:hypothetical protein BDFB_012456, partial [Asbolus verrucosus]